MKRREIRLDRADAEKALRIDSAKILKMARMPQGYLRVPVYATRTGVFTYFNADGTVRRELRHPEDVFSQESLETLKNIPITNDHPNVKDPSVILITAENTREFMVGFTGEQVEPDGDHVSATAIITDASVIDAIERGKREVSCGYQCEREMVPGVYGGIPYDIRQRNIVYNHLAVVDRGRAGRTVKLRLDSADAVQVDDNFLEENMEKIVINGVEYEVSKAVADAYRAEQASIKPRLDAAEANKTALDTANSRVTAETKRADRAEARCDTLESELTKTKEQLKARTDADDPKKFNSAYKTRKRVMDVAERVLPDEKCANLDSMDNQAIMTEVIKAESPNTDLTGKSADYIEARFDSIVDTMGNQDDLKDKKQVGMKIVGSRNDAKDDNDSAAARAKSMKESQEAWKTKSH